VGIGHLEKTRLRRCRKFPVKPNNQPHPKITSKSQRQK